MAEGGLAELPEQHQASGQAEGLVQPLQFRSAHGVVLLANLGDLVAGVKAVKKGIDSQSTEFRQLFPALV
jgi:hypothetical protein